MPARVKSSLWLVSVAVAQSAVNRWVVGSNPTRAATSEKFTCLTREVKEGVKQERVFSRCVIPSLAINKDE